MAASNTTRARLGAGDVPITLLNEAGDPEDLVLKPSYNAARTLSRTAGGLMGAMERVAKLDTDTVVQVITLGLGYDSQNRRAPRDLDERVWSTGLSDDSGGLAERCVTYIRVLMSGGKLPKTDEAEARDDSPDPPPS